MNLQPIRMKIHAFLLYLIFLLSFFYTFNRFSDLRVVLFQKKILEATAVTSVRS
jgi:hypothetical protein